MDDGGNNGAQMNEEDEEEEGGDGGSPEGGQGLTSDDYEEIDYKICGELGKFTGLLWTLNLLYRGEEQSTRRVRSNIEPGGSHLGQDTVTGSVQGTR